MKKQKILFITYDLSGYYTIIHEQLTEQFSEVDFYNIAEIPKYKYKSIKEWLHVKYYKTFKNKKIRNLYKLRPIIDNTKGKAYDYTIIIRPDLFLDSQLIELKNNTKKLIAFYHDSINNIPRKKEVIPFFDKVYAYEKRDALDNNIQFLPNFIYLFEDNKHIENKHIENKHEAFTILANDYRFDTVKKVSDYFMKNNINYTFLVFYDRKKPEYKHVEYLTKWKKYEEILQYLKHTKIIVDIHKYGIQNGLTFRVFESLFLEKKLITTNADIKTYDFYNPNNIHVIDPNSEINIPESFFNTPYQTIPTEIYQKYHYTTWLKTILS